VRVALVTGTLEFGGGETQLVRLAHELAVRGHTVRIFVLQDGGPLAERVAGYGLVAESWDFHGFRLRQPLRTAGAIVRAGRSLRRFRPDVVHAYLESAYLLGIPMAWLLRVPVRVSARRTQGEGQHYRRRLGRSLHRLSVWCSDAIVANSESVAASAIAVEHVDPARVHVIENGVDLPAVSADVAAPDPLGIIVANIRPEKNHEELLRALATLAAPPRIRIIGDGAGRPALERLAAELGVAGVVEFAGLVPDAACCFAEAQFSLLVSRFEGMPNAVLESMAYGVPVVGTAIPGIASLVDDGVDGLLVPPGDVPALAAAIERISSDPALRTRLGAAARDRMQAYSWERLTQRHLELYHELAPRRRRGDGGR
jgi:glycosyltransferase involved in cell wall biosynthesis